MEVAPMQVLHQHEVASWKRNDIGEIGKNRKRRRKNSTRCPICSTVFRYPCEMRGHFRRAHKKETTCLFHDCGFRTDDWEQLIDHYKFVHYQNSKSKHTCTVNGCGKTFFTLAYYVRHKNLHIERKGKSLVECNKRKEFSTAEFESLAACFLEEELMREFHLFKQGIEPL